MAVITFQDILNMSTEAYGTMNILPYYESNERITIPSERVTKGYGNAVLSLGLVITKPNVSADEYNFTELQMSELELTLSMWPRKSKLDELYESMMTLPGYAAYHTIPTQPSISMKYTCSFVYLVDILNDCLIDRLFTVAKKHLMEGIQDMIERLGQKIDLDLDVSVEPEILRSMFPVYDGIVRSPHTAVDIRRRLQEEAKKIQMKAKLEKEDFPSFDDEFNQKLLNMRNIGTVSDQCAEIERLNAFFDYHKAHDYEV